MKELMKKYDWENWSEVIKDKNDFKQQDIIRDTVTFLFGYLQNINNYITYLVFDNADIIENPEIDRDFKKRSLDYISRMEEQKYKALDMIEFILYYVAEVSNFNLDDDHIENINNVVVDCYNHAYTLGWFK